ncbi:MAG: Holliday junction branch migration DNA helicase RuvB [Chlamydiales bacterium]
MPKNYIETALAEENPSLDVSIRPQALNEFIGQESVRERLEVIIGAAKQRGESLGHCLFSGPPGLGKTTLSHILSKAMGTNLVTTSGPVIEKLGDLAGILTNLREGDILFIDEIHRLNRAVEECLYSAMEDFTLDLVIDSGPNARTVQVGLAPFTLVGATTKVGLLTSPLRSRFGFSCRLEYYSPDILKKIVLRTASILNCQVDDEGAIEIANRARGTPRIANNLTRWVRDFTQMQNKSVATKSLVIQALDMLSIDEFGLDEMDRKILSVIIDHYQGGPVGINTIAVAVGEEGSTIEEVHEPYLILQGFIKRTPRGREVTPLAYRHMQRKC